jgi:TPP-dependent 2-oxoacid decarboxylase
VINNQGYSTERPILDGPFNDVHPWQFSKVPAVLGGGIGFIVKTEEDLAKALLTAEQNTYGYTIIDVKIDRDDRSPALNRLTGRLAERVKEKEA